MVSNSAKRGINYVVFGLNVFLIFCLLFESYMVLPNGVAWLGRWHPVILHFPIVLLLIAIFLGLTGKKVPWKLLMIAVLSALITAISGFFLGSESGIKGDLLYWHQWMGAAVALIASVWYGLAGMGHGDGTVSKVLQVILIGLVGFTGHYGGMVTHGEDFLALPKNRKKKEIPENPLIYEDVVGMILDDKCVKCHNSNKQKGELLMTDLAELRKGGESGSTLIPGEPENSEMIKRLHLLPEDEEHMPPEGERPLTPSEIQILERWIALGASDSIRLGHLDPLEPLVGLVRDLMEPDPMEKWKALPAVADTTINNLSSDYLTVTRIASHSDALSVSAYLPPEYRADDIVDLKRVANNIVELDLSGLPLGAEEMALVAVCTNLEWLELDRTPITDAEMAKLQGLTRLGLLKIYETHIGDASISVFRGMKNLKSLYIWETGVSPSALEELKKERPNVHIDYGIDDGTKAFFVTKDSISKTEK